MVHSVQVHLQNDCFHPQCGPEPATCGLSLHTCPGLPAQPEGVAVLLGSTPHIESQKLAPRYIGPYVIDCIINPIVLRLTIPTSLNIHPSFHVSLFKPVSTNPLIPRCASLPHQPFSHARLSFSSCSASTSPPGINPCLTCGSPLRWSAPCHPCLLFLVHFVPK